MAVYDDLPDDGADAQRRVVERAAHRAVERDDAIGVLQQGRGELHGQRGFVLGRRGFAPFELVDPYLVLCRELAVVDLVVQVGEQLALRDVVARELAGVGVEYGQRDVLELEGDVRVAM